MKQTAEEAARGYSNDCRNRRILTLSLLLYECLPMLISCIVKSVKNVKRRKENNYESVKR